MGADHLILTDVLVRGTLVEPMEGEDAFTRSVDAYAIKGIKAHVWNDAFVDAVEAWFHSMGLRGQRVSSGLLMVAAAITSCGPGRVRIYGFFPFGCDGGGRRIPYHYYEPGNHDTTLHDMSDEFKILRELQGLGIVELLDHEKAPAMRRNETRKVRHGYLRYC